MNCAEHYFENLLIHGTDCPDNVNRDNISEVEQKTIEMCAQYVIYTLFDGRADFDRYHAEHFIGDNKKSTAHWMFYDYPDEVMCSYCGEITEDKTNYCPNCGREMTNSDYIEQESEEQSK